MNTHFLVTADDTLAELRADESPYLANRDLSRVHVIGEAVLLAVGADEGEILHKHPPLQCQLRALGAQRSQRDDPITRAEL